MLNEAGNDRLQYFLTDMSLLKVNGYTARESNFAIFILPTFSKLVNSKKERTWLVGCLVVLGLTALCDSISVYIGPSPREREKEKTNNRERK